MQKAQKLSVMDPQNPSNIANMKKYVESFGTGTKTTQENTGTTSSETNSDFETMASGTLEKILASAVFE
jgi:hypothetical protein